MKTKPSLNQRLRLIGFRIGYNDEDVPAGELNFLDYDIEETLIAAGHLSLEDYRILSILLTWVRIHGDYVIVEKFMKKLKEHETENGVNPIFDLLIATAVTAKYEKWSRWVRGSAKNPVCPIDKEVLESSIAMRGKNEALAKLGVLVPNKFLRVRDSDAFTVEELIECNLQYRNRYLFGPSWRADIITAIQSGAKNAFQTSKSLGCSYEPAYRITKEYLLAQAHQKQSVANRTKNG